MSSVPEQPAGIPARSEEKVLWEGYPSMRTFIPEFVLWALLFGAALILSLIILPMLITPELSTIIAVVLSGLFVAYIIALVVRYLVRKRLTHYRLTTERIFIERGLFNKRTDELELERYKDVFLTQTFMDRIVGCGDIRIVTGDATTPTVDIVDVANPVAIKEMLRSAARERQQKLMIVRREEI